MLDNFDTQAEREAAAMQRSLHTRTVKPKKFRSQNVKPVDGGEMLDKAERQKKNKLKRYYEKLLKCAAPEHRDSLAASYARLNGR